MGTIEVNAKPRINVGFVGQSGHGKSTLLRAIAKELASRNPGQAYELVGTRRMSAVGGIATNFSVLRYESDERVYDYLDFSSHDEFLRATTTGAASLDCAVVVAAMLDGVQPELKQQVQVLGRMGTPQTVVFLNKCDMEDEPELSEMAILEIQSLLSSSRVAKEDVPAISGSATRALEGDGRWKGKVEELLDVIEQMASRVVKEKDKPTVIALTSTAEEAGNGKVTVQARVERGQATWAQELSLVEDRRSHTALDRIELDGQETRYALAGSAVKLLLRGFRPGELKPGMVLSKDHSIQMAQSFTAQVYVLPASEGGPGFLRSGKVTLVVYGADVTGTVRLENELDMLHGGEVMLIHAEVPQMVAIGTGTPLCLRNGGQTIALGQVLEVRR